MLATSHTKLSRCTSVLATAYLLSTSTMLDLSRVRAPSFNSAFIPRKYRIVRQLRYTRVRLENNTTRTYLLRLLHLIQQLSRNYAIVIIANYIIHNCISVIVLIIVFVITTVTFDVKIRWKTMYDRYNQK